MKNKALISFLAALLLFTGCNVQQREIRKLQVLSVRYLPQFKILANTLDPCFTGKAKSDTVIKIDSIITPGQTNTIYTKGKGDTIVKTITIQLPGKIKKETKTITDTIPDMRAIEACHATEKIEADSLRDNKVKLVTETKKADKYCLWFWLENGFFILIIIVVAVWKVYGLFNGTAEVKAGANILNYFKKK
jgi:hypothetical protein